MSTPERNSYRVFVGGLPYSTGDEVLREFGEQFGNVRAANVMRDGPKGKSRGFGFITFADKVSRDNALAKSERVLEGRTVEIKRAVPRDGDKNYVSPGRKTDPQKQSKPAEPAKDPTFAAVSHRKIFCGGLHYSTTEEDLKNYFQQFGEIESVQVVYSRETSRSRGFGFVVFTDAASVQRVVNRRMHTINDKMVEVKLAVPKDSRYPGSPGRRSSEDQDLDARASWLSPSRNTDGQHVQLVRSHSNEETSSARERECRWSNIVASNPSDSKYSSEGKNGSFKTRASTLGESEVPGAPNNMAPSSEEQQARSRASTLPASIHSFSFGDFSSSELGLFQSVTGGNGANLFENLSLDPNSQVGEPQKPDVNTPQLLGDPTGENQKHRTRAQSGGSHFSLYSYETAESPEDTNNYLKSFQKDAHWLGTGIQSKSSDSVSNPSSQYFGSPIDAGSLPEQTLGHNMLEELTEGQYMRGTVDHEDSMYSTFLDQNAVSFVPNETRWATHPLYQQGGSVLDTFSASMQP
eukprot:gb/GECG01016666.1/.p1 GENE.gb/GECG01016666.1/~~gb/GECG01016666.1/.p1  ORF type:complete len:521 (+),score=62.15 gb/GECG01016666.1/:1-1563(+)